MKKVFTTDEKERFVERMHNCSKEVAQAIINAIQKFREERGEPDEVEAKDITIEVASLSVSGAAYAVNALLKAMLVDDSPVEKKIKDFCVELFRAHLSGEEIKLPDSILS